jgi:DNA-directed RNA polymerase specialized sigma24 family protein
MFDGTGSSGRESADQVLSAAFVAHSGAVTRYIHEVLGQRDWQLAEDLTSEVFIKAAESPLLLRGVRVSSLLVTLANKVVADLRGGQFPELTDQALVGNSWGRPALSPSAEDLALAALKDAPLGATKVDAELAEVVTLARTPEVAAA